MASSASSRIRECETASADADNRAIIRYFRKEVQRGAQPCFLLFLLQVPELPGKDAAAEWAVVHTGKLVALAAEHQEIFRIDFGNDGAVGKLIQLRFPYEIAVHQALQFSTAAH